VSSISRLLAEWKEHFRLVVMDLPPPTEAGLALSLAAALDGVVLVVEADRTPWDAARRAKAVLVQSRANVLGVVLNKQPRRTFGVS
jgi:Mrp family chromosome partitioning ATPase